MEGVYSMRKWMRDMPLTMDEVKALMRKKDKQSKWLWIGVAISVICSLVALVLWLRSRCDDATEHYYEYFDDEDFEDFDEDFDDDFDFDEDESDIEYVEITDTDDKESDLPE